MAVPTETSLLSVSFVHAIAGAAGGIQGRLWCPQRGEALAGEVDMSLVERHDLGEQLLGRTEDARHPIPTKGS